MSVRASPVALLQFKGEAMGTHRLQAGQQGEGLQQGHRIDGSSRSRRLEHARQGGRDHSRAIT